MNFYVIGEDKSLVDVTELVLSLAGGNMTGDINFSGSKLTESIIRFMNNTINNSGNGVSIGGGGVAIFGSGGSAQEVQNNYDANVQSTFISADDNIHLYTNAKNGLNRATLVSLGASGIFSGHQKAITSGSAAPSGGQNGDIYIQY